MTTIVPQNTSSLDAYARGLGSVFASLQSLELQLRLFLYKKRSSPHTSFRRGQNLTGLRVGTVLPENAVTDYDSLGDLVKRYNSRAKHSSRSTGLDIDQLVTLRDALAHGRVFLPRTGFPLQLIKFTKPHNGKVKVKFASTLTPEWLVEQNNYIQEAIIQVLTAQKAARRQRHP